MASAKPNQKIQVDKLEATLAKLEQLEEKQKSELTLRESIYFLRDKLRSALKKGYSYQDLTEILEQQGILVSAATLKQYLTESHKEVGKGKRFPKSGQALQTQSKRAESTAASRVEKKSAEAEEKPIAEIEKSELEESQERNKAEGTDRLKQSELELAEEKKERSAGESQQETKKTVKAKPKRLASSSTDLAGEFNQY